MHKADTVSMQKKNIHVFANKAKNPDSAATHTYASSKNEPSINVAGNLQVPTVKI